MKKNLLTALWHADSRKVAFGLLLFIVSTVLGLKGFLNSEQWMLCMGATTALIGGGTVADAYLGKKNVPPPPAA